MMFSISYPSGTVRKDGVVQTDLSEYIAFLQANGTPDAIQEQVRERISITAWQLMQQLIKDGLYDPVNDTVMASGDKAMIAGWTRAPYFYSDHPMTLTLGASLGKSADDMCALFQSASTL